MKFVGIDACKSGWVAAILKDGHADCTIHSSFADVWVNHNDAQCFFVDIPIGLAPHGDRQADIEARKLLPSHLKSSIFNTPVRRAVYAATKEEARSINRQLTGKSLSVQSLGLCRKIREVDECLQREPKAADKLFESHPEINFCRCAGAPLAYSKNDLLGALERIRVIEVFVPEVEELLAKVRKEHPRTQVAADDVLDALMLAISAKECSGVPTFLPAIENGPPKDETGLPMAIWYHDFSVAD